MFVNHFEQNILKSKPILIWISGQCLAFRYWHNVI